MIAVPWRVTSRIKASAAQALFEQLEYQYGPDDRALKLAGTAELRFGKTPRLDGVLSARGVGKAIVTATHSGLSATVSVTVSGATLLSLMVLPYAAQHFRQTLGMTVFVSVFVPLPVQVDQHQIHHGIPFLDRLVALQPEIPQA